MSLEPHDKAKHNFIESFHADDAQAVSSYLQSLSSFPHDMVIRLKKSPQHAEEIILQAPLLIAACVNSSDKVLKTVLEAGANPNCKSRVPTFFALQAALADSGSNYLPKIKLLLAYNADPDIVRQSDATLLQKVTAGGLNQQEHNQIARALLIYGADKDAQISYFGTPLIGAIRQNNSALAQILVAYDADLYHCALVKQSHWKTAVFVKPLSQAICEPEGFHLVKLLALYGAQLDFPGHYLFKTNDIALQKFLLSGCPNLALSEDQLSKIVQDPLQKAVLCNDQEQVSRLTENKDRALDQESTGITPLHWAASRGYEEIIEILLARKAPINSLDPYCRTPLDLALFNKQISSAKLLKDRGGAYNLYNPLWWAIHENRPIHDLLDTQEGKQLVNKQDQYGNTPVHKAAAHKHLFFLELLLRSGGNVTLKNHVGINPEEILTANQHFTSLQPYVGAELIGPLLRILYKSETPEVKAVGQVDELCFHIGGHLADLHYPAGYKRPDTFPSKRVLLIETLHRLRAVARAQINYSRIEST